MCRKDGEWEGGGRRGTLSRMRLVLEGMGAGGLEDGRGEPTAAICTGPEVHGRCHGHGRRRDPRGTGIRNSRQQPRSGMLPPEPELYLEPGLSLSLVL